MKINEKTLTKYVLSGHCDREGWLFKRGEVNRAFQKRYCRLRGNVLSYFASQSDKEPVGAIILEGCRVEVEDTEANLHCFKVAFAHRTYIFAAPSHEEMEDWVKVIARSSYEYLHLTSCELQKQLSDIKQTTKGNQSSSPSTSSVVPPQFSKKTFAEVHHMYEVQFRQYFAQQREKHAATSSVGLLIDLS